MMCSNDPEGFVIPDEANFMWKSIERMNSLRMIREERRMRSENFR